MALNYTKTKVLTPYNRTILPITLAEFSMFADPQGAYDITDSTTILHINAKIAIARNNLESYINAPLIAEEWEYTAFVNTPYQQYNVYLPHIRDFNHVSIKTNDLDSNNQYIWYDIPQKDWYCYVEDELSIKHNIVNVQSDSATHKALNISPSNKNIQIKFIRGVYSDINAIPPEVKQVIAQIAYNLLEGLETNCTIQSLLSAIMPYDTIFSC